MSYYKEHASTKQCSTNIGLEDEMHEITHDPPLHFCTRRPQTDYVGPGFSLVSAYVLPTGTAVESAVVESPWIAVVDDTSGNQGGGPATTAPPGGGGPGATTNAPIQTGPGGGTSVAMAIKFSDTNHDRWKIAGPLRMTGSQTATRFRANLMLRREADQHLTFIAAMGETDANVFNQGMIMVTEVVVPGDYRVQKPPHYNLVIQVIERDATGWNFNARGLVVQVADLYSFPPQSSHFHGDTNPLILRVSGNLTVIGPEYGTGLTGGGCVFIHTLSPRGHESI